MAAACGLCVSFPSRLKGKVRISFDQSAHRGKHAHSDELPKGILDARTLPDDSFDSSWDGVILDASLKDRLLNQAVLNFTLRSKIDRGRLPLHGIILLVGPPGTGKTSPGRGLASKTAASLKTRSPFQYLEVEPHGLASSSLGRSQQAVRHLLSSVVAERAQNGPLIVLLDEVETLAADRSKLSLEANPVDVHRATDAVLAQLDQLAGTYPHLLFIATSNFSGAIDSAFLSRADLIATVDLPGPEACEKILIDTVKALEEAIPKLRLSGDPKLKKAAAARCRGMDGRRIRKVVISALSCENAVAADPGRLTADHIAQAVELARNEIAGMKEGQ